MENDNFRQLKVLINDNDFICLKVIVCHLMQFIINTAFTLESER